MVDLCKGLGILASGYHDQYAIFCFPETISSSDSGPAVVTHSDGPAKRGIYSAIQPDQLLHEGKRA